MIGEISTRAVVDALQLAAERTLAVVSSEKYDNIRTNGPSELTINRSWIRQSPRSGADKATRTRLLPRNDSPHLEKRHNYAALPL